MKLKLGILAGVATLLLATVGAWAQVAVQVGVQAGGSIASTDISAGGLGIDGVGMHSSRPDFGVRVGGDWRIAGSPFVVGAFGEFNDQDVKFAITPALFSASLGNSYSFGGRVGWVVGGAMPYAGIAWTHSDAKWSVPAVGLPSSFQGLTYLAGLEIPLGYHFSLAAEARLTRYDSQAIGVVDLQPDQLQTMVRLNYNFGGDATTARQPLK